MQPVTKRFICWGLAAFILAPYMLAVVLSWSERVQLPPGVASLVVLAVLGLGYAGHQCGKVRRIAEAASGSDNAQLVEIVGRAAALLEQQNHSIAMLREAILAPRTTPRQRAPRNRRKKPAEGDADPPGLPQEAWMADVAEAFHLGQKVRPPDEPV